MTGPSAVCSPDWLRLAWSARFAIGGMLVAIVALADLGFWANVVAQRYTRDLSTR